MAEGSKGIIGSIAVHLGIVAVLVGASWYAARHSGDPIEAVDPLLVNLDGIPGRKAGLVGEKGGVARGHESGTQSGIKIVKIKPLDVEKIKEEAREAQAQANAERTNAKTDNAKTSKTTTSGASTSRTTFSDFQSKQKGGTGRSTGSVGLSLIHI
jgi:restriction endonuclease Mrr